MANAVNILQLSMKYRRMGFVGIVVGMCVILLHVLFVLLIYPPTQTLKLQTYRTYNIITITNNYKINISCSKISFIILHYKKKALHFRILIIFSQNFCLHPQLNCYQLHRTLQCGYHLIHQHSLVH